VQSFFHLWGFLFNPFTELGVVVLNLYCVNLILSKIGMSRVLLLVPAVPVLVTVGFDAYLIHQAGPHAGHIPINTWGFTTPLNQLFRVIEVLAVPNSNPNFPVAYETFMYVGTLALVANWILFVYVSIAKWPILRVKEELEAAVGRQGARRDAPFVGDTGMEPSAPVTALLNRPPGSRLNDAIAGRGPLTQRRATDAERVAELQRQVQGTTPAAGPRFGAGAAPAPDGPAPRSGGLSDAQRVANLISTLPTTPATAPGGYCPQCGGALGSGSHACPLAGSIASFCPACGAPRGATDSRCARCGSAL
jgi:hypothetical protein